MESFPISALSDEIAADLEAALATITQAGIAQVELRTVLGKNILDLTDDEVQRCRAAIGDRGLGVSGLASPIGKSELERPAAYEEGRLKRALQIADALDTHRIRIFSFYPVAGADLAEAGAEVVRRVRRWTEMAQAAGVLLLLENEVGLWGDLPDRCARLLREVDSAHLRFAWDPANFLRSGVSAPFDAGWPALGGFVACAHVKDCQASGQHTPAGQGDGQWPELVAALRALGGVPLVMEPHLQVAGHSTGFTGPERFLEAVAAIRALLR